MTNIKERVVSFNERKELLSESLWVIRHNVRLTVSETGFMYMSREAAHSGKQMTTTTAHHLQVIAVFTLYFDVVTYLGRRFEYCVVD